MAVAPSTGRRGERTRPAVAPSAAGAPVDGPDARTRCGPWRTAVGAGVVTVVLAVSGAGSASGAAAAGSAGSSGDPPGTWWYNALVLDEVQATGATGAGVTIGLIDSPVDPAVPELQGADVVPVVNACQPDAGPDASFASGRDTVHGTSVASVIVGSGRGNGPSGVGTRGVAPEATVRVYVNGEFASGLAAIGVVCRSRDAPANEDALRTAFERAIADEVDIINFSSGQTVATPEFEALLSRAAAAGIVVVASAGNDGVLEYPASGSTSQGVVGVTWVDSSGFPAPMSPRDPRVVVAAPGVDLLAGVSTADGSWQSEGLASGSSLAAPIVTGALALVKQRYPEATGNQLVQHLVRHTTEDELVHDDGLGFGILSLREMLENDPTMWADVNPLTQVSSLDALPAEYPDEAALRGAVRSAEGTATGGSGGSQAAGSSSGASETSIGAPPPGTPRVVLVAAVVALVVLLMVVTVLLVVARRTGGRGEGRGT
ncbi:MAG: S8 family serine peptidase [Kineosporiaceae bacterium]